MKSFALTSYGKSDNFEFRDIPRPEPAPGQLLIEVHAAGLNPLDLMIANGEFKQLLPYRLPLTMGHENQVTSYQAQVDHYTRYINDHAGWQLVGIYTDEGINGTSTKHRARFQSIVTDALAGKIDLIITKSVS